MGMFNYIKVEQELPLNEELKALNNDWLKEPFQTKELGESLMDTYIIRGNNLYKVESHGHWEDNPEYTEGKTYREFFNKNKWVKDREEEIFCSNTTTSFEFGTYILGKTENDNDIFPDWKAVVVKGVVTELTLVEDYFKKSSKDRVELDKKFKDQIETHQRKMNCPVYSLYFNYYVKSIESLGRKISYNLNKPIKVLNWLQWKGISKAVNLLTPR
jgi:hypothetical protein